MSHRISLWLRSHSLAVSFSDGMGGDEQAFTLGPDFIKSRFGIPAGVLRGLAYLACIAGTAKFGAFLTIGEVVRKGFAGCVRDYDTRMDFEVSKEQYDKALRYASRCRYRLYHLFWRNCTTFTCQTLNKAGIKTPWLLVHRPRRMMQMVERQAEDKISAEKFRPRFPQAKAIVSTFWLLRR